MMNRYLRCLLPLLFFVAAVALGAPTALAQQLESDNFIISNDELMVGSLDGESSSFSLIGKNSPLVGSLESDNFSQEGVLLGENVPTPTSTSISTPSRSCNEPCSNDGWCSGDLVCYGNRCRSSLDLDDTSCPSPPTATPTPTPGLITRFFQRLSQLFDISLELDDNTIDDIKELVARVIFESFGTEPTPVDMTFVVVSEEDGEMYRVLADTVVETEAVYTQTFENVEIDFSDGKYTLVLTTLYNVDVEDEFKADFWIGIKPPIWRSIWFWVGIGGLLTTIIVIVVIKKRKKKEKKNKIKEKKKKKDNPHLIH